MALSADKKPTTLNFQGGDFSPSFSIFLILSSACGIRSLNILLIFFPGCVILAWLSFLLGFGLRLQAKSRNGFFPANFNIPPLFQTNCDFRDKGVSRGGNFMQTKQKGTAIFDLMLLFFVLLLLAGLAMVLLNKPELVTQYLEPVGTPKPLLSNLSNTLANASVTITAVPIGPQAEATPALGITPVPTQSASACSPNNRCLATKPDFCLNGAIVPNCGKCGCPEEQECKPEGCIPKQFA